VPGGDSSFLPDWRLFPRLDEVLKLQEGDGHQWLRAQATIYI